MGRMFGTQAGNGSARAKARLVPLVLAGLLAAMALPMAAFGKGGGATSSVTPAPAGTGGTVSAAPVAATVSTGTGSFASQVRQAAFAAGLDSLAHVAVPQPSNLSSFVASKPAAIALGKALFWDQQLGSDGQACASCHFNGGADNRTKGQLNPGTAGGNTTFGGPGHANFNPGTDLTFADFPFHTGDSDTKNVASSQGVFNANFKGVSGGVQDLGTPVPDPVFNLGGANTRKVDPRNAPTAINSVFNSTDLWDGKSNKSFNGVNANGPTDASTVLVDVSGPAAAPAKQKISLDHSSLAGLSAIVGTSNVTFSYTGRTMPLVGRKVFGLVPLGFQKVDPSDSVLGKMANTSGKGLTTSYQDMIKKAFLPKYWDSTHSVAIGAAPPGGTAPQGTQMEANFALFFGLATQTYEATLVSSNSPFDKFMEGNDNALTATQLQGLLIFINTGQGGLPASAAQGNCVSCHAGPEFTAAGVTTMNKTGFISIKQMPVAGGGRIGSLGTQTAYVDNGFANIGVRPTAEDPGRGGSVTVAGKPVPMSWVRQALAGIPGAPPLPPCGGSGQPACPVNNRDAVQGAFKIPGLRNVELTGPYFHNGGQATLDQAVRFYDSFDFSQANIDNLDPRMLGVNIGKGDADTLTSFLQSLTDPNVRAESGAFDHPQLFLPNGPGADNTVACLTKGSCSGLITVPATGSGGRVAAGETPQQPTFLNLDPHQH